MTVRHSRANTRLMRETAAVARTLPPSEGYVCEDMMRARREMRLPAAFLRSLDAVQPGDSVKVSFLAPAALTEETGLRGETMWVEVTRRRDDSFEGILRNVPFALTGLKYGQVVKFQRRHIHSFGEE